MKPLHTQNSRDCARAWYGGKEPPNVDVLDLLEVTDSDSQLLYSLSAAGESGDYTERMQSLRHTLQTPALFSSWDTERSQLQFFKTLLDYAPHMSMRFQVLLCLGSFKGSWRDNPQVFKQQIENFFAPLANAYDALTVERMAQQLSTLWAPHPDSLLDHLLHNPTLLCQILGDRLDPGEGRELKIIGHSFAEADPDALKKLILTQTVAYERRGEIHFNMAVRHTLEKWEEDPTIRQSVTQEIDLFDTLLLHELVEIALEETTDLSPLSAHIAATSFERCLKDSILAMAIDVFFLDWQPSALLEDQREIEGEIREESAQKTEVEAQVYDSIADLFAESEVSPAPAPDPTRKHIYNTEAKGNPDGKSVIVIDDSPMIRKIVSDVVVKMGHNIIEAADGAIGIPLVRSRKPDLIVLDLVMAKKGGMETLKELRSDPNFKTTPIIMLTTESNQRVIREAMTWRVNDYLVKPIGSKKLKERIAAQLDRR